MQTEAVLSGMADALAGRESPISLDDMNEAIDDLNKRMLQKQLFSDISGVFWEFLQYSLGFPAKKWYLIRVSTHIKLGWVRT